jgi:GTP cyclohydrolase I
MVLHMNQQFDIQTYMTKGVERVVKDILKAKGVQILDFRRITLSAE